MSKRFTGGNDDDGGGINNSPGFFMLDIISE
jgi:hypothetical protein